MTIDDCVIITLYNINIKFWIFDPFWLKIFNNQNNDNWITHRITCNWLHNLCKKKQPCGLTPPDDLNKAKKHTKYIFDLQGSLFCVEKWPRPLFYGGHYSALHRQPPKEEAYLSLFVLIIYIILSMTCNVKIIDKSPANRVTLKCT